jgi:hypothetical protein
MPQPVIRSGGGSGGGAILIGLLALILLGGGAAALVLVRGGSDAPKSGPVEAKPAKTKKTAEATAPTIEPAEPTNPKKMLNPAWASGRIFPIGVDVDGDGTEDLLGPTVHADGANKQIYVTAFDGKTFTVKHEVGPFGKADNNVESAIQVAAAGKRFVVLDPKGDAHLYELDSGKLVADFPFREENRGLCGPPALEPKVLIRVGKGDFIIDTAAAIGKPGSPPPWCAGDRYMRRRPSESYNTYSGCQAEMLQQVGFTKEKLETLKTPPKTSLYFAFVDGPTIVGVASQTGSEGAMLLGFDAKGALTYQVAGSAIGLDGLQRNKDLAYGRFVFAKGLDQAVVAVDAKSGEKLWEAKLRKDDGNLGRMSLTEGRVWITRWKGDDAFVQAIDAANGKVLGSTGK